jgi:aryl-alcohol dehydrogenase-like predicted oxidoreductase
VQVRSVYLQGVAFLAPDALPEALAPLRAPLLAIERWANARGLSVPEAFLLFALGLPRVSLVVGFEREAQLAAALAAVRRRALGPSERAELASLVPPLDADLLEPSRWPSR